MCDKRCSTTMTTTMPRVRVLSRTMSIFCKSMFVSIFFTVLSLRCVRKADESVF